MITAGTLKTRKARLGGWLVWCAFLVMPAWSVSTAAAEPLLIEVVRAEVGFDQRTRQPVVSFTMTDSSRRAFAELTRENVGRPMEIRVDGRVITKPVIREPIVGGSGQLFGGLSVDQAKDIAERLSTGTAKLEIEVVPN
jgi:preprotein translocase subunit SecD